MRLLRVLMMLQKLSLAVLSLADFCFITFAVTICVSASNALSSPNYNHEFEFVLLLVTPITRQKVGYRSQGF